MRKKLIVGSILVVTLISSVIFLGGDRSGREKTLEGALGISQSSMIRVIHEEPTEKGSIIFSTNDDDKEKYLYTSFINKNLFGYKDLYSGSDSINGLYESGLTAQFFPPIEDTSLPIYFGAIGNDEITEIKVKERSRSNSEWKSAKIIDTDDIRIWLVYMKGFKGSDFDIAGFDAEGKEVFRIADTIAPWTAEQEPEKSPY